MLHTLALVPKDIQELRKANKVSQPVFARYSNGSGSTVEKWEAASSGNARFPPLVQYMVLMARYRDERIGEQAKVLGPVFFACAAR